MAQTEEDVDRGEDGSDEGDDGDKEGERGGGLLAISLMPLGEEEAGGLLLKPDVGVKSMGQDSWSCRFQTVDLEVGSKGKFHAGRTESRNQPGGEDRRNKILILR